MASDDRAAIDTLIAEAAAADTRQARLLTRRREIAEIVAAEGTMRIEDLAARFDVSLMTAHRDLDDLAARGVLIKTRGTATQAGGVGAGDESHRASRQLAEKSAIATAAAGLIAPGEAILMDDSTTVAMMAPHLVDLTPLTVITNSLGLMGMLKDVADLELLGLGGAYCAWCDAFLGHRTIAEIGYLRVDTVFLSGQAITDGALFHRTPLQTETKRAMIATARRRILLADHTKFDRRALYAAAALTEFDALVTDDAIPADILADLRGLDLELITTETKLVKGTP